MVAAGRARGGDHGGRGRSLAGPLGRRAADEAEVQAIAAKLAQEFPESNARDTFWIMSLSLDLASGSIAPLVILVGTVGFVLMVACANVAGMLLGGLAGVLLAYASLDLLRGLLPVELQRAQGISIDGPVQLASGSCSLLPSPPPWFRRCGRRG